MILEQWGATVPHPLPAHGHLAWSFQRQANIFHIIGGFLNRRGRHIVSRFEALLPHGQPRLTLGEMLSRSVNSAHVRNIDGLNCGCIEYWGVNSIYVCGVRKCGSDS
jgi:hypothetical protein